MIPMTTPPAQSTPASADSATTSPAASSGSGDAAPPRNVLAMIHPTAGTFELSDPHAPQLLVDDQAPHRGDGIFETVLVSVSDTGEPRVHADTPHFERFENSAAMLELTVADREVWDAAVDAVAREFIARNPHISLFSIRYSLSRGTEEEVGWALSIPISDVYATQRREGIRVLGVDRGYQARYGLTAPWALVGAKTLSYATNMAAGRWAAQHNADEVLYVTSDGVLLEGPTCNLVIAKDGRLLTPNPEAGLLHGTTQRTIFTRAQQDGFDTAYVDLTPADLETADAAWMVSSVRMAVPIISYDDTPLSLNAELTARMSEWVLTSD